jgi:hypothetical protein
MELNDLLNEHGINPATCLVLRHRPPETQMRRVLPWLAAEQPDVFNMYQRTQSSKVEQQMKRAESVAAFIGHEPARAIFVGLYEMRGYKELSRERINKLPEQRALSSHSGDCVELLDRQLLFDLSLTDACCQWKGKLIVRWPPPELAWSRWAIGNHFEVEAILEESQFSEAMPDWREIVLTWEDLKVIPTRWKQALEQWRGIYFIQDAKSGRGYVGSAYGSENLYRRWMNYAKSGHGGNKQLRDCSPKYLRFSILERMSPDIPTADVIAREATWKVRLHTRSHGLNGN